MQASWEDFKLFLAVAESGSLSAAARTLGLTQPTLSRRMADLETSAGERLFVRRTQGIELTEAALRLLPAVQRMAEWAAEAGLSLAKEEDEPSGRVRIAAPPGVAQDFLAPFAGLLLKRFPKIQLDVLSGMELLNLARGEADLSLRVVPPADPELICLDQISAPLRIYVSRDYAASLPTPCAMSDLRWIGWSAPSRFLCPAESLSWFMQGIAPVFTTDDYNIQVAACEAGVGAMLEAKVLHRFARIRHLVELDIDLSPEMSGTLYLVCHRRQQHLQKVRSVIDALREEFAFARQS